MKPTSKKNKVKFTNKVVECKYTDKKGFKVTLELLEKLLSKALSANKEPFLIIGIKRKDNEYFILNCTIEIKRK